MQLTICERRPEGFDIAVVGAGTIRHLGVPAEAADTGICYLYYGDGEEAEFDIAAIQWNGGPPKDDEALLVAAKSSIEASWVFKSEQFTLLAGQRYHRCQCDTPAPNESEGMTRLVAVDMEQPEAPRSLPRVAVAAAPCKTCGWDAIISVTVGHPGLVGEAAIKEAVALEFPGTAIDWSDVHLTREQLQVDPGDAAQRQTVAVACVNANGESDIFVCSVMASPSDEGHRHISEALEKASDAGYDGPYLCFDASDMGNLLRGAAAVKEGEEHG